MSSDLAMVSPKVNYFNELIRQKTNPLEKRWFSIELICSPDSFCSLTVTGPQVKGERDRIHVWREMEKTALFSISPQSYSISCNIKPHSEGMVPYDEVRFHSLTQNEMNTPTPN